MVRSIFKKSEGKGDARAKGGGYGKNKGSAKGTNDARGQSSSYEKGMGKSHGGSNGKGKDSAKGEDRAKGQDGSYEKGKGKSQDDQEGDVLTAIVVQGKGNGTPQAATSASRVRDLLERLPVLCEGTILAFTVRSDHSGGFGRIGYMGRSLAFSTRDVDFGAGQPVTFVLVIDALEARDPYAIHVARAPSA